MDQAHNPKLTKAAGEPDSLDKHRALVNDGVSSFTDRAAAFLLPGGLLLGGCLLVIVAGRWRSGH